MISYNLARNIRERSSISSNLPNLTQAKKERDVREREIQVLLRKDRERAANVCKYEGPYMSATTGGRRRDDQPQQERLNGCIDKPVQTL